MENEWENASVCLNLHLTSFFPSKYCENGKLMNEDYLIIQRYRGSDAKDIKKGYKIESNRIE